ncbi:c-type cytochrome [Paraburkholderia silviterrae]|uniref:Cytochrome c n=1 Tax=Paraburkholderia silviterrae TaxID=2528715 RepID=A0A4V2ZZ14_9BURK|nr:cytochrome c [Paraburkholderia silviterrae]TDG23178.1 cytochrome c [Paraburkholderia silviterrae]
MKTGISATVIVLAAAASCAYAQPSDHNSLAAGVNRTVEVSFPESTTVLPPGEGAEIVNSQCVICHSAGMITRQPPLSFDQWKAEVEKMRTTYGAPLPVDQIETVARYLATINGKH